MNARSSQRRRASKATSRSIETSAEAWLLIEVGGSSAQTVQRDSRGRFWFSPGVDREQRRPVALACPGLIREGQVLYATNLGWPDSADPAHELGLESVSILENDARAAGLGESILRSGDRPAVDLFYINLGTGVGDAKVVGGTASHFDIAHHYTGGTLYCTGCRGVGCVNAYLCSQSLPAVLTGEDCDFVARTLASAIKDIPIDGRTLLVLGGGIARRYPVIVGILDDLIPNPTELTAAPAEAKSAAYLGLDYLARRYGYRLQIDLNLG